MMGRWGGLGGVWGLDVGHVAPTTSVTAAAGRPSPSHVARRQRPGAGQAPSPHRGRPVGNTVTAVARRRRHQRPGGAGARSRNRAHAGKGQPQREPKDALTPFFRSLNIFDLS